MSRTGGADGGGADGGGDDDGGVLAVAALTEAAMTAAVLTKAAVRAAARKAASPVADSGGMTEGEGGGKGESGGLLEGGGGEGGGGEGGGEGAAAAATAAAGGTALELVAEAARTVRVVQGGAHHVRGRAVLGAARGRVGAAPLVLAPDGEPVELQGGSSPLSCGSHPWRPYVPGYARLTPSAATSPLTRLTPAG